MYVSPFEGPFSSGTLSPLSGTLTGEAAPLDGSTPPLAGDSIARSGPPWLSDGSTAAPYAMFGPLMGMLSQLMQMLQSLMGYQGCGNERFFRTANGSSEGDPHLSFNGNRWNCMASQPDLLNSNSFRGGYQISTQTTPANGKGVSWNQSATVALDGGSTSVTLNANGQPAITRDGQSLAIGPGQTLRLGDGESVTADAGGALSVTAHNGSGGSIVTTLTARGNGVDVDVVAHDVDLGGALVNGGGFAGGIGPQPDASWQPPSIYN